MDRRRFLATGAAAPFAAAAAPEHPSGVKTLRVAFPIAESGFDPAVVQDYYSNTINVHIFDTLLTYDYMARPAKLIPNTAAALPEVSGDYRTFTIRLRPGILFQDDPAFGGRPRELVAEDYVYSLKRVFDPRWKSQVLFILEPSRIVGIDALRQRALKGGKFDYDTRIEGLRALDRYTLQFRLAQPSPRFIYMLTSIVGGAVAREVVEAHGDQVAAHPVGTGPFQLGAWTRSSRIILERNPTFRETSYAFEAAEDAPDLREDTARLRGRRIPLVDRVEITIMQEDQPRWLTFAQGGLDLLQVPLEFIPLAAPNGVVAPHLARRGVRHRATPLSDATMCRSTSRTWSSAATSRTRLRCAARSALALTVRGTSAASTTAARCPPVTTGARYVRLRPATADGDVGVQPGACEGAAGHFRFRRS
jgi:ABC-type transport system substrate-binding protein